MKRKLEYNDNKYKNRKKLKEDYKIHFDNSYFKIIPTELYQIVFNKLNSDISRDFLTKAFFGKKNTNYYMDDESINDIIKSGLGFLQYCYDNKLISSKKIFTKLLEYTYYYGDINIFEYIIEKYSVNIKKQYMREYVVYSIVNNKYDFIEYLQKYNIKFNIGKKLYDNLKVKSNYITRIIYGLDKLEFFVKYVDKKHIKNNPDIYFYNCIEYHAPKIINYIYDNYLDKSNITQELKDNIKIKILLNDIWDYNNTTDFRINKNLFNTLGINYKSNYNRLYNIIKFLIDKDIYNLEFLCQLLNNSINIDSSIYYCILFSIFSDKYKYYEDYNNVKNIFYGNLLKFYNRIYDDSIIIWYFDKKLYRLTKFIINNFNNPDNIYFNNIIKLVIDFFYKKCIHNGVNIKNINNYFELLKDYMNINTIKLDKYTDKLSVKTTEYYHYNDTFMLFINKFIKYGGNIDDDFIKALFKNMNINMIINIIIIINF